jgi:hypothetical protein
MTEVPDILTLENKEKFRRKLLVGSRILALLLILAIVWVGYVQMTYANEVRQIKEQYGSLGYCYMCGLETYRKCDCQYIPDVQNILNPTNYSKLSLEMAQHNILECPNLNREENALSELNFSLN